MRFGTSKSGYGSGNGGLVTEDGGLFVLLFGGLLELLVDDDR